MQASPASQFEQSLRADIVKLQQRKAAAAYRAQRELEELRAARRQRLASVIQSNQHIRANAQR